jgi:predicted permease
MSMFDAVRYRLYLLTHRADAERDAADEIEFHLRLDAARYGEPEMSPASARAAATRRFGNVTYYREELRRMSGGRIVAELSQDMRFAFRSFRRTPTFTAIAILTLAVGIGANTAIFSAVDALLLRPLPFREPERLMNVSLTAPAVGRNPRMDDLRWSYPKFVVFRDAQGVFENLTLWAAQPFTLRAGDDAVRDKGEFVDSHYMPLLGITPALGRGFVPAEDQAGAPRVVVISDALWRQLYNADPMIRARTIEVDGTAFQIVGVAPPGFKGLSGTANIWVPSALPPVLWAGNLREPYNHFYHMVGRLRADATPERARVVAAALGATVDAAYPVRGPKDVHFGVAARELDGLRVDERIRRTLLMLTGAVGLVLLISCANVANLFLVRASSRRREIATRLALGASRGRLVRQLLVESVLLSAAGGLASVGIAWGGVRMLSSLQLANVLRLQNPGGLGAVNSSIIHLDAVALVFTGAVAIGTGILFGLVPALQATRPSLTGAIRGDGATGRRRGPSSRDVLVTMEIALAVVLLAASGLMIRSLSHLLSVRPGFDASQVLVARVNRSPGWARDSITRFYDVAVDRLGRMPGVIDAAMIDCAPLEGCDGTNVIFPDRPRPAPGLDPQAGLHWITPAWFAVMHVPLLRGRAFNSGDVRGSQRVVIVSERAAREFWPGEDPVGRPIALGNGQFDSAIVAGVVGDVHFGSVDSLPNADVYIPYAQSPLSFRMMTFVRTRGEPGAYADALRDALREVAPGFPVYDVSTMSSRLEFALAYARFSALLLAFFASVALVLAAMGTYGVMSYSVTQRTREIGVRSALGATRGAIVRLVIGQGVRLAVAGVVVGLIAAVAVTRLLTSLLFGVQPGDPLTLAGIVCVLMAAVLAASWIPARRAVRIPVVSALRVD